MFSIDDPEISAEELSRRVREDAARWRAERGGDDAPAPVDAAAAERWALAHRAIASAAAHAVVGEHLPPMRTLDGVRRRLAVPVAKLVLRAARLFLPQQTTFNLQAIAALRALAEASNADQRGVEHRLAVALATQAGALAALRGDLVEHGRALADHVAATAARLDALERELRVLAETRSAAAPDRDPPARP